MISRFRPRTRLQRLNATCKIRLLASWERIRAVPGILADHWKKADSTHQLRTPGQAPRPSLQPLDPDLPNAVEGRPRP